MFGIVPEFLVIVIVALVLLGPAQLPGLMKTIGKGINEFRRMTSDVKSTLEREIQRADEVKRIEEIRKELFEDQTGTTELQQEAAEAAAKREAESVKPVEAAPVETAGTDPEAEALKLVDAAKAEAAKLIANAQAEAEKLLQTAESARMAENAAAETAVPAEAVHGSEAMKQAEARNPDGVEGKARA